jgi:hypothetical protein
VRLVIIVAENYLHNCTMAQEANARTERLIPAQHLVHILSLIDTIIWAPQSFFQVIRRKQKIELPKYGVTVMPSVHTFTE